MSGRRGRNRNTRDEGPSGNEQPDLTQILGSIAQTMALLAARPEASTSTVPPTPPPVHHAAGLEAFRRLRPPTFYGTTDPMVAESWIMQLEKTFSVLCCTDEQRVQWATFVMEGPAKHWWRAAQRQRETASAGEPWTWGEFLDVFYRQYFPAEVKEQKEIEFLTLEQGNMSVADYEAKYVELSRFAPHLVASENMRVRKFERGLKPIIRDRVSMFQVGTWGEVVGKAKLAERQSEDYFWRRDSSSGRALVRGQASSSAPPEKRARTTAYQAPGQVQRPPVAPPAPRPYSTQAPRPQASQATARYALPAPPTSHEECAY